MGMAIGIDLGTTNSCAAIMQGGRPRLITYKGGKTTIPSVFAIDEKGNRLVGDDADLLFGLQLTHSGRYSYRRPIIATPDPLLVGRYKVTADTPLISDDELKGLVDHYVTVAKLAVEVGFDFLDVKQCHRYLLNELLGARNRPGPFGGSYENRMRLQVIPPVRGLVYDRNGALLAQNAPGFRLEVVREAVPDLEGAMLAGLRGTCMFSSLNARFDRDDHPPRWSWSWRCTCVSWVSGPVRSGLPRADSAVSAALAPHSAAAGNGLVSSHHMYADSAASILGARDHRAVTEP